MDPSIKRKLVFCLIILLLILLFLSFFYLLFKLLTILLPNLIAYLILCYVSYSLIQLIINFFLFPGSFWVWRRNIENQFSKAIAKKTLTRLKTLKIVISVLLRRVPRSEMQLVSRTELHEVRKVIESFTDSFQALTRQKTLNRQQEALSAIFQNLTKLMMEIKLKDGSQGQILSVSMFEMTMKKTNVFWASLGDLNSPLEFEFEKQGEMIEDCVLKLERAFLDIIEDKSRFQSLKRWALNNSLGTVDQMRVELETRFRSKRILLTTHDKNTLDCFLILPAKPLENAPQEIGSLMIFCNPNAGYYEFMYYETDWIEFYTTKGVSIFLWNYRGYGKSTGHPTTQNLHSDADFIYEFIANELKPRSIGVHGTSLGGIVATYLANSKKIEVLIADRTFASVSEVARLSFGRIPQILFQLLTNYDVDLSMQYFHSTCFKILVLDPKDEIIHLLSSLFFGVTRLFLLKRSNVTVSRSLDQKDEAKVSAFKRLFLPFQRKIHGIRERIGMERKMALCFNQNMFSNQEIKHITRVIKRVLKLTVEILSTSKTRISSREIEIEMDPPAVESNRDSIEISIDRSKLEQEPEKDYDSLLGLQKNEETINLAAEVFKTLDGLEAIGLSISEIFLNFSKFHEEILRVFILGLENWGSYSPIALALKNRMTLLHHQKLGSKKLKDAIKTLDLAIKAQKTLPRTSLFHQKYLCDIERIHLFLLSLSSKLKKPLISLSKPSSSHRGQFDEKTDFETLVPASKDFAQNDLILPKSPSEHSEFQLFSEAEMGSYFGNLIAVSSGHNGCLSEEENARIEALLRGAGFIRTA